MTKRIELPTFLNYDGRFISVKIFKLKLRKLTRRVSSFGVIAVSVHLGKTMLNCCHHSTSSPLLWEKKNIVQSLFPDVLQPRPPVSHWKYLGLNMTTNTAIQCYFGIQIVRSLLLVNSCLKKEYCFLNLCRCLNNFTRACLGHIRLTK